MNQRLVLVAVAAAAIAAGAAFRERTPRAPRALPARAAVSGTGLTASPCPPGSLPDDGVCIPVPPPGRAAHRSSSSDGIPRRPDRPVEYARYLMPVEHPSSIAELGDHTAADGGALPSGIAIDADPGAPVSAVALEGQDGLAQIVYQGSYWGITVITLHTVRTNGVTQQYLVTLGQLASLRQRVSGDQVSRATQLGTAGASPLVLDTRLLRPGIEVRSLSPRSMLSDATSAATDARNVLRTKTGP